MSEASKLIHEHLVGDHAGAPVEGCTGCTTLQPFRVARTSALKIPKGGQKCGCGCGASVQRRFLPGHDSKLKSRLLKEARAGSDIARQKLVEQGWERFI